MHTSLQRALCAFLTMLAMAGAHAGRPCEARTLTVDGLSRGFALAERTAAQLDRSGADVVVIARVGQDLGRYGLRYSHLGFAHREPIRLQDGTHATRWRVVHKLNHCRSDTAALYRHGLADFFLDDLHAFEAGIVVPTSAVQAALLPLLRDNRRVQALHEPAYNMVAYPWAQTYQQSNQWALETLAHAMEAKATNRRQAQAWLALQGYRPTTLHLGPATRLGAQVGGAHVRFDDHPSSKRFSSRIQTVTVDSVFDWLLTSGLGERRLVVR